MNVFLYAKKCYQFANFAIFYYESAILSLSKKIVTNLFHSLFVGINSPTPFALSYSPRMYST